MTRDPEALVDIPAADAELVDAHDERELLTAYRNLPAPAQHLVVELTLALQAGTRGGRAPFHPVAIAGTLSVQQ